MTKLIGRLSIMVALTVALLGVPAAAQAKTAAPTPNDVAVMNVHEGDVGTQAYCDVHPKYSTLTIRSGPGTNYGAVGSISRGQWLYAACSATWGGAYRCTSSSSVQNWWVQVRYGSWGRYVALDCTYWHQH